MNFLAHLYLSGDDPKIMLGNFIGDFVRGRDLKEQFGERIAMGIELHRAIDEFTDKHQVVKQSKNRLWPNYRHYAAVIVDIYYDHFLAANWSHYSSVPLEQYAADAYKIIDDHLDILPEQVKYMMPYMTKGNWLLNYAKVEGIHRALTGMSRRATFESRMEQSVVDLQAHYSEFESEFMQFFPELERFSTHWRNSN